MNGPGSIEIASSGKKDLLPIVYQYKQYGWKEAARIFIAAPHRIPFPQSDAGILGSNLLKVARCRQILTNTLTFSDKSISLLGKS